MKIFLIGFMGAGKTTLGKYAARHCGMEFMDLDQTIEEILDKKIPEIFKDEGEDYFRKLERMALEDVSKMDKDLLISTGGGTPCFHNNMDLMNEKGITVYLDLSASRLTERLRNAKQERPLLRNIRGDLQVWIHKKLMQRASFYGQAQHVLSQPEANKKGLRALIQEIQDPTKSESLP